MAGETVTLREYVETLLAERDKALVLQTEEIHRRLDQLNGEQARLAADRAAFVPRESYEQYQQTIKVWQDAVNQALAVSSGRERGTSIIWTALVAAGGLIVTMAGLAVAIIVAVTH